MRLSQKHYESLVALIKETPVLQKTLDMTDNLPDVAAALASAAMAAGFSIDEAMLLADLEEDARQMKDKPLSDNQLETLTGGTYVTLPRPFGTQGFKSEREYLLSRVKGQNA